MTKTQKIKLNDLHINTENYRFDPVASQKEAIDKMVDDQGDKLFNLAEHIIQNGLNPNAKVQVVVSNHDNTKYNVLEGNRRIVALKLLNHPDLLDGSNRLALKNKFSKLHDENKEKILKEIECTIYDDPKEADVWIGLKHGYGKTGTSTDEWDPIQKGRFEEQIEGKSSIVLQTIKLLQNSPDVPSDIKSNLSNLKVTNLERLILDPDVRDFLGVEINNGVLQSKVNEKEVIKGLSQITKDLLDPKFKVQRIYTKEDRTDYINKFPKESKPNKSIKATKPWQINGSSSTPTPQPTPKPKPIPKQRKSLIPKNCLLKIKNPKVNSIYHELQKLNLSKFTNIAAISLRVFIENSMDCFIEEKNLTATITGKPLNKDSHLHTKITEVANYLENNKLADKNICKYIRNVITIKTDLLGIETLNAYVHNENFSPIPSHLTTSWDNIQPFIEKVWANIK